MCQARIPFCCGIVALALTAQGNATGAEEVSFELDVQPILAVRGCNQGACHGKARGQNGFQLSLLGFDSNFDFSSIAQQSRGRRVFPAAPAQSLLLRKATAQVPHGGGQRFAADSEEYQLLQRWIAQGAPRRISNESKLVRVELSPKSVYLQTDAKAQLAVKAFYSDGSTRDVTDCTQFQSNEDATVSVNANGIVKAGSLPGEATIMARYMNNIETSLVSIPLSGNVAAAEYEKLPRSNFIDELVWNKLQTLGITPAELCDDAKYLRRIHIDLIGRLPTPDEDRAFLASDAPDKRTRAVDTLLERPEYADHWASKWADLLRPNPYRVGIKAVINYDQTIRDAFRKNLPYDQFVRQLVTAQGSTWHDGATVLYRDRREPEEVTTLVSQLFLGIRLECAKCHHHPFEKWSQDDFYSFAAFFGRVGRVGGDLSPPISGEEEMIFVSPTGVVKHPLTEKAMQPRVLFGKMPAIPADADPREVLAKWMTSKQNPYFAKVLVNRVWADLMGRGIVEPVDDLRATNPPTNPELLDALATHFQKSDYDVKELLRTIVASEVYALGSLTNSRNQADRVNYSRHYRTRLRAEVLSDALSDITGRAESFPAMPNGSRANQIWTTRVDSVLLDTFGRQNENQDPPCERLVESTVTQALHLMNSPQLYSRLTHKSGRAAKMAASNLNADELTEEIYLLVYGRTPVEEERQLGRTLFDDGKKSRQQQVEDLLWALINTPEFAFKD